MSVKLCGAARLSTPLVGSAHRHCEGDKGLLATLERCMPPDRQTRSSGIVFNLAGGIQSECPSRAPNRARSVWLRSACASRLSRLRMT
ncbi:MAG: hypothetical protein EOS86_32760 [Mesorhizobium sp.]|nr:MAG: hypothetical protein EOR95_34745 [Mesorhizobium sp.]RWQ61501.1 MAG: hypothetical protein EOS86_32760 [Mesorhizobium sp.]